MVGSAIVRCFKKKGFNNLLYQTHRQLDLIDQQKTLEFFKKEKPDYVIIAAAKVGGILANSTFKAQFIYENIQIQNNLIHSAFLAKVKKLLFLGSACIYPRLCSQPIKERSLLSGYLEPTNEFYSIAKIAGIKLCQGYFEQYGANFISAMPNNLYGPNDNFDLETSHVMPALIRKIYEAKIACDDEVEIWGSGKPLREFLHVDDLAEAVFFLLNKISAKKLRQLDISHINIGSGEEISIKDLAILIKKIIGFKGSLEFNTKKPDGMPRKLLDNSIINKMGWKSHRSLENGTKQLFKWYLKSIR
tara:strand:- start:1014 stop:1922 length:909 start_codon:yes stop_codon:yes gene_type:complete